MKITRQLFLFLVFLWTTKAFSHLIPIPTEHFLLHETLDHLGNYHVFWKFNKTHITFEVHVKTRGYVGFGISPNGKMYPSDVVVGWVKDGVPHLSVSIFKIYYLWYCEWNFLHTMLWSWFLYNYFRLIISYFSKTNTSAV